MGVEDILLTRLLQVQVGMVAEQTEAQHQVPLEQMLQ